MSVEYFMDKCTDSEVNNYVDCIPYCDRNMWEGQRMIGFLLGKANFKGINKSTDLCQFVWDKEHTGDIEITNEQIADVKAWAEKIKKNK